MSASGHTYTWLDNNKKPIKIPAIQYINLVQKWISGKITDPSIFPTDASPISSSSSFVDLNSICPSFYLSTIRFPIAIDYVRSRNFIRLI